jgi:exopolyphosphatase/pppGpp-phosphohydrolase
VVEVAPEPTPEPAVEPDPISDPAAQLAALAAFAARFPCDQTHTDQVLRLSLALFEALAPLHGLGARERVWLHGAALIHDIGWYEGRRGHHKRALQAVIETADLPLDEHERLVVGNVARYHRRALPDPKKHEHFAALSGLDRRLVRRLAAILRLADGLDASHQRLVEEVSCRVTRKKVVLTCRVRSLSREDVAAVHAKSDLFDDVFKRRLEIGWLRVDQDEG